MALKVLLIGSGGREHALAWSISQSNQCEALYCAPGNAGIESCAECIDIGAEDIDDLVKFAKENAIDLVVVGPEAPLVLGLADRLEKEGIAVFGPSQKAARLEGSKGFTKDLCKKYDIPTASYEQFDDADKARAYINSQSLPIVIKADGLAAGKGVIIAETKEQAENAIEDMLSGNAFGEAGHSVIIEEFLDGEEVSFFAIADGETVLPLTSAQDHKRAYDNDEGPNTGGMGAYSPARLMDDRLQDKIMSRIITPTLNAMKQEGCPYKGVLYAGLMIVNGEPKLIEYNARFGDPECQAIMLRLRSDLLNLLNHCALEKLADMEEQVSWYQDHTMCVVMAAKGYPGKYEKGTAIGNLNEAARTEGVQVFHAGTGRSDDGNIINTGGRVLGVTSCGRTLESAQKQAYEAISKINWPDGFYRTDIGWRALKKANSA